MKKYDNIRDFLKDCLRDMKAKTGLNQYENLRASKDAQSITALLDGLEATCNQFGLIDLETKVKVIEAGIMRDGEFKSFNNAIIYRWLLSHMNDHGRLYGQKGNDQVAEQIEARNREFYQKQLAEKKKANPDYSPIEKWKEENPLEQIEENSGMTRGEKLRAALSPKNTKSQKQLSNNSSNQ